MNDTAVFHPEDFLVLCHKLLYAETQSEAKYRTIMSRAYYATYLYCAFNKLNVGANDPEPHTRVYKRFRNTSLGKKDNHVYSRKLYRLWVYRLASDYYLSAPMEVKDRSLKVGQETMIEAINYNTAKQSVKLATEVINAIGS